MNELFDGPSPASGKRDPDADVLARLAHGDEDALGDLMERHLGAIKNLAWHMLGDEMAAEDIAQEVFIKAWKQALNWQTGHAKFSTWLYRVAKNACLDRLRKKREIYSDEVPEMVDEAPLASEALMHAEDEHSRQTHVQAAIALLPERQRLAITLCHYQELSQKQAAEIMEIGVRAYESLLARARRSLRTQLRPHKQLLIDGSPQSEDI